LVTTTDLFINSFKNGSQPNGYTSRSLNWRGTNPSTASPGKFDYRISCIIDESGDEVNTVVTAATDEEAIELTKKKGC